MPTITKEYKFEAAHILDLPYPSGCNRLHGHSYQVVIEFTGQLNEQGMVHDYTTFPKDMVMELDHKFLVPDMFLAKHHPDEWKAVYGSREFTLPPGDVYELHGCEQSTAEEIARHLFNRIKVKYGDIVSAVTVCETATSSATHTRND